MKVYQNESTFPHPWSTLTSANFQKYPNPLSTQVLSVDVLRREIDPQTGHLLTERLLCCQQPAPALLRRLLPIPEVTFFREISVVDPKTQTYAAKSWNLSMRSIIEVEETCVFKPHPSAPQTTIFAQTAQFTAMKDGWANVAKMVEDAAVQAFQNNAGKGRKGLELVIDRVVSEAKEVEERLTKGFEEVSEGIRQGLGVGEAAVQGSGGGGKTGRRWWSS
ncbi:hypothetical protein HDV00_008380 [Rhizophlyctis rosea]|nr:hypothetical protein HDV00_008380 [Rhizophlyctis rosea]